MSDGRQPVRWPQSMQRSPNRAAILAIDYDPDSLALVSRLLTEAGYLVRPAESGEVGLAAALVNRPDVILIDVGSKGMDGLEVCRSLRSIDELRTVPIIMVRAFADTRKWAAGLDSGASDYVTKPIQPEELLSRVRTHLSLGRATAVLEQQAAELHDANTRLHEELVEHARDKADLERALEMSGRSRLAMLGMLEDQRRSDAVLREESRLLSESQRLGHVGSWFGPTEGPMTWSEEAYRIVGVSEEAFVPTVESFLKQIHPDDRPAMNAWIAACGAGASPDELEFRLLLPDGTARHVLGRGDVVRDIGGRITHIAGTVQDITDRKLAEEQRAVLESERRQIQKMESVGRLAGGVAHDFNNMLGVILGHVESALRQVPPDVRLHADLMSIHDATVRSANLTRQLLAFARKQDVEPRALDINEVTAGMLMMIRRLIGEDISVRWLPAPALWPVRVDPVQVDQMLTSLCLNARDAISGVGTITIETGKITLDKAFCAAHAGSVAGDYTSLAVIDEGCGMNTAELSRAFEPFFTTKPVGRGTGMGLATVYGIVKQNHGYVNIDSTPNHGTTVRVYLPRYVGPVRQTEVTAAFVAEPRTRGHETILLVEDEPSLLRLTTRMLESEGYSVLAAGTPGRAIGLATEHAGRVSLLITDVIMPEMNGRILANKLLSLNPSLKHLFISGYTDDVIAEHGVLDEGVIFLQKPFSIELLARTVRDALDDPT